MSPTTTPTRRVTSLAAPNWERAACNSSDPDLFFPVGDNVYSRQQAREAVAVCVGCPVRVQCLSWALETGQDQGVWGGTTEKERRAIHRRNSSTEWGRVRNVAEELYANRLDEFLTLRSQGLEGTDLAAALGTNVQTVNRVSDMVAAAARAAAEEVRAA